MAVVAMTLILLVGEAQQMDAVVLLLSKYSAPSAYRYTK
jgi:hypothetical protein